jgi:hypothetical protein
MHIFYYIIPQEKFLPSGSILFSKLWNSFSKAWNLFSKVWKIDSKAWKILLLGSMIIFVAECNIFYSPIGTSLYIESGEKE